MVKYIYNIGSKELIIYDETINNLTKEYGFTITQDQIDYAVKQLRQYGAIYWAIIDNFALLSYYMEQENVQMATASEVI